jgi:hypothetical protein
MEGRTYGSRLTVLTERVVVSQAFFIQFILNSLGLIVASRCVCRVVRDSRDLVIPRYASGTGGILNSGIAIVDEQHCVYVHFPAK